MPWKTNNIIKDHARVISKQITQGLRGYESPWVDLTFKYIVRMTPVELEKILGTKPYGNQLDHFIPVCAARTKEEAEWLCHGTNFQWLSPSKNFKKGSSIPTTDELIQHEKRIGIPVEPRLKMIRKREACNNFRIKMGVQYVEGCRCLDCYSRTELRENNFPELYK